MKTVKLGMVILFAVLLAEQADAARYYVRGSVGASGSGLSWGEAKKTVAEAMDAATTGSEVWVAAGTYTATTTNSLVVMKSGVSVYGGFAGSETDLSQSDPVANPTILDGANVSWRVVRADHVTTAVLDGFIIKRGNSPYTKAATYGRGAGIYLYYSNSITISNCTIASNTGRNGGGIFSDYSSPIILNCAIYNNRVSASGGGIYLTNGAGTIANCTVAGNSAAASGGGMSIGSGATSTVVMDCVISANAAVSGGGCGSWCTMTNCLITGNQATDRGGAVTGAAALLFCTIDGNTAPNGGGWCSRSDAAPVIGTMTDCIWSNNTGHAINADYKQNLSYSLFYNNSPADYYDALGSASYTGASSIDAFYGSSLHNQDGNPDYGVSGCASGTWTAAPAFDNASSTTLLTCATANLEVNALAGKLLNPNLAAVRQCYVISNTQTTITVAGDATGFVANGNSWRIMNYALDVDSAAIDWGTATGGVTEDINGVARPVDIAGKGFDGAGQGYDMGAYEYTAAPVGPFDIVWLDFAWNDIEWGTEALPFNTLDEGLANVTDGGTIKIKPGAAAVSKRVTKHVRIEAPSGGVRIGAN